MDSNHLLVPIKVQALVIDNFVTDYTSVVEIEPKKYAASAVRWSPQAFDYRALNSLSTPGPKPFYGATRKYQSYSAEQLVIDPRSPAVPKKQHRGVYLHWVLPAGLRHAYTPGLLDFPALPDHWLIVRFSHRDSTVRTNAWFVDGSTVTGESGPGASLLFPGNEEYTAKRVGKVVPLEEFATANFSGERTTITALGNAHTGSPTFTAFIAENRNIFSWHDTLADLREPNRDGDIPKGTILTYSLIGWYRDPKHEPLAAPAAQLSEKRDDNNNLLGWLIEPPGWFIEARSPAPADLLKRRSVFHGMVAYINYWSATTYKGRMLGYPGAPLVGGVIGKSPRSFKVGVGNNAEDALVSLVSSEYSGEQEEKSLAKVQPNLWKALEAVIYRQSESLVKSWDVTANATTVHQNWFSTREAGKIWYIRPTADKQPVFPSEAAKTAKEIALRPTAQHLAKLKELNQAQSELDAVSRELAALQTELYARWWKVCAKSRSMQREMDPEKKECEKVIERIMPVRNRRNQLLERVRTVHEELTKQLPKKELEPGKGEPELELKYDASPRFWMPADPVVVVRNCGLQTKHEFPRQHPCRLPEEIVTTAEVAVNRRDPKTFSTPAGVSDIAAAAQKHLPACPEILSGLLNEASIVQQAIRDLVERSLLPNKEVSTEDDWRNWTDRLVKDITWDGDRNSLSFDEIKFGWPNALNIRTHRLADLWVQQPWSPLFIDWQITWFPTAHAPDAEHDFSPVWNFLNADFVPRDSRSIPTTGYTIRGRSLLTPIDDRIFKEPIDTLRKLVQSKDDSNFPPAVTEILSRYEIVWDKSLKELAGAGLLGQTLSGFHHALLRRDVTLPRISPDPARPWIAPERKLQSLESEVRALFDVPDKEALISERLAPPDPAPITASTLPFAMLRAGALRIDELWLIDDFGQSADLLGRTPSGSKSSGQVFHPRIRWYDDPFVLAMPPRVLQPIRLNFRFVPATDNATDDPALSLICGWIFYNPLDQALVLCDRDGKLVGHLAIVKEQGGTHINWETGCGGVALNNIRNQTLQAFAQSLVETTPTSKPKLVELLNLIDSALERIRPGAGRRDLVLFGRPLALVNATLGLELFGKAWSNPDKSIVAQGQGTGDVTLDALRVRVNLGYAHSLEDGLVGFYKGSNYNRIIAPQPPEKIVSNYIGSQKNDFLRVGFGTPEEVTMLMDPWGSVQAACGIVPAKTITLAHAELDKTVAKMEASFRVGPVLLQADRLALPTPAVDKGTWNFSGPITNQTATALGSFDTRNFSDQPVLATEGRLVLLNEE